MSRFHFIKNFIKDRNVAAITPTSIRCVKRVCKHIDFAHDFTLVEYGPGDGVFTRFLLRRMSAGSRLILVEANQDFVQHLTNTIDDERVSLHHLLADEVESIIDSQDIGCIDYVLSGIPFSFFDKERKRAILEATRTILKEGGKFLAYQTSGHLKKPVMEIFGNYHVEIEMLNIPPYVVYEVVKNGDISGYKNSTKT